MSGLNHYLERKRQALKASPYHGVRYNFAATSTAEGYSGVRRIRIRDFQVITDSGPAGAGFSLGPAPGELLAGALAACINHGILIQAATQQVKLDAVEVKVAGHSDDVTKLDEAKALTEVALEYAIEIKSGAADSEIANVVDAAVRNSFVYNLLFNRTPITGGWQRVAEQYNAG